MKQDKSIIIRISDITLKKYKDLLDINGMNLSKRIKKLISDDIKKLKNNNDIDTIFNN